MTTRIREPKKTLYRDCILGFLFVLGLGYYFLLYEYSQGNYKYFYFVPYQLLLRNISSLYVVPVYIWGIVLFYASLFYLFKMEQDLKEPLDISMTPMGMMVGPNLI